MTMSSDLLWLLAAPLVPLGAAALIACRTTRRIGIALMPWASLPAFAAALTIPVGTTVSVPGVLLGLELRLDATAQVFLVFTALLWWLAGVFASAYLHGASGRHTSFWVCFSLAMSGNLGVAVAADVLSFYAWFTMMSLASYGLVVHDGSAKAVRAGRVYMRFAVAGELALFAGLVGLVSHTGTLAFGAVTTGVPAWALACAAAGFGVKAGVLGLHAWLPLAHPAAPVPASAVLSGAMIKTGVLGWLRLLPLGAAGFEAWGWMLFGLGVAAAFYGAAAGVVQREAKSVLAYSSVSQMGLITAGLGFGLARPEWSDAALVAVLLYVVHHAIAKASLFLAVGVATHAGPRLAVLVTIGAALPALSLAGAPLTSGALAKTLLKMPLLESDAAGPILVGLLSLAAVGTTLLMLRFLVLLRASARAASAGPQWGLLWPWTLLLVAGPVLALLPWPAVGATQVDLLTPAKLALAIAPLLTGLLLGALGPAWLRRADPSPETGHSSATPESREDAAAAARSPRGEASWRTWVRAWRGRTSSAAMRVEHGLASEAIAGALWLGLVLVLYWAAV
jgi:formate hydrogenlyase subunit 3/multisubunit Na+/H+ antiporter MnhD subunit